MIPLDAHLENLRKKFEKHAWRHKAGGPDPLDITGAIGSYEYKIYLQSAGNETVTAYDADATGLAAAIADAGDGDIIILPAVSIDGDFTVPAGVSLIGRERKRTVLTGQITIGAASVLYNLTVERSEEGDATGVVCAASADDAYLYNVTISVTSTSGNATGVWDSAGTLCLAYCNITATAGGVGRAVYVLGLEEEDEYTGTFQSYNLPTTASVDSYWAQTSSSNLTLPLTEAGGEGNCMTLEDNVSDNIWSYVIYDLGGLYALTGFSWYLKPRGFNKAYISEDKSTWTLVSEKYGYSTDAWMTISETFAQTNTRYVKFMAERGYLGQRPLSLGYFTLTGTVTATGNVNANADMLYCALNGSDYDIAIGASGAVAVYACQYDPDKVTGGTVTMMDGDRAAIDHTHDAANLDDLADVTITTPADGELIRYDGSGWINNTLAEAGIAGAGHDHDSDYAEISHQHTESDITDLDHDAVKLQGRAFASTAPTDGQAIIWDGGNTTWKPGTVSGGGAFTDLTDVPAAYTGDGGKYVKVNAAEDGLEFDTPAGSGDMTKATYDTDNDGSVDKADAIDGIAAAGNSKYYGTDSSGTAGFHDLPSGSGVGDDDAIHDNVASEIHAITEKTIPTGNDELIIEDSANSYNKKRVKKSSLWGGGFGEADWTIPTTSTFAVTRSGNGGVGTITNLSNGLGVRLASTIPSGNTNSLTYAAVAVSVGAAGWRTTIRMRRHVPLMDWLMAGIIMRDSVSGKSVTYALGSDANIGINRQQFANDDTWNGYAGVERWYLQDVWLRVLDDLTNWYLYVSIDGNTWYQAYQETRNTYLGTVPTHVGIFLNPNCNGGTGAVHRTGTPVAVDFHSFLFESLAS